MKTNIVTLNTFKGYSNIISDDIKADGMRLAYITMKLDDKGQSDLTELRKVREIMGITGKELEDDTLMFSYTRSPKNSTLYFDGIPILYGEELKMAQQMRDRGIKLNFNYDRQEKMHLKLYTLLASLTKRMMNDNLITNDGGMVDVFKKMNKIIMSTTGSQQYTYELINHGIFTKIPFQQTAAWFHKGIVKTMGNFFK